MTLRYREFDLYLLRKFPQALHTAEHVAAPQQEAAKANTWMMVSCSTPISEQGICLRCRRWGQPTRGEKGELPSCKLIICDNHLDCSRAQVDIRIRRCDKLPSNSPKRQQNFTTTQRHRQETRDINVVLLRPEIKQPRNPHVKD